MLSKEELLRYARHLSLDNVGITGQEKLKSAKVLVIGAGGLGTPILQYLTAAGVGTIGIIDHDVVNESNLQRQVLYSTEDVGKSKVFVAIERLHQLNPFVTFIPYETALSVENALEIFQQYDIVLDGTDNFPTRYLVNDACVILNKPFVHGSIFKFQGQISVFNYQNGPSYRCLYPTAPSAEEAPNCSEVGVLGVLPGVIGTKMATECLKMILGIGTILSGMVEVIDVLQNQNLSLKINRNEANFQSSKLEASYDAICNDIMELKATITPQELNQHIDSKDVIILDVREDFELDICSFENPLHIPLGQIPTRWNEIPKDTSVIAVCHHGIRSANAIAYLEQQGFENLSNLEGGIHAWAVEIDPNMATY